MHACAPCQTRGPCCRSMPSTPSESASRQPSSHLREPRASRDGAIHAQHPALVERVSCSSGHTHLLELIAFSSGHAHLLECETPSSWIHRRTSAKCQVQHPQGASHCSRATCAARHELCSRARFRTARARSPLPGLGSRWVTEFSGKTPCRETRGFAGREKQPQPGAFRHCKPAACILGLTGATMRLSLICGFP